MNENQHNPKPDANTGEQPKFPEYPNTIPTPEKDWSEIVRGTADQTTLEKFFESDATLDFRTLTPDVRGALAVMRDEYLKNDRSLDPIDRELASNEMILLTEEQQHFVAALKKYREFLALHIDRKFSLEEEHAHYVKTSSEKNTEEIPVVLPPTEPLDLSEIYNPLDSIAEAAVAARALEEQARIDQWTDEDDRQVGAAVIASQAPDALPRRLERIVRDGDGPEPRNYERPGRRSTDRGKRERY